jgi:hypothetical protein
LDAADVSGDLLEDLEAIAIAAVAGEIALGEGTVGPDQLLLFQFNIAYSALVNQIKVSSCNAFYITRSARFGIS